MKTTKKVTKSKKPVKPVEVGPNVPPVGGLVGRGTTIFWIEDGHLFIKIPDAPPHKIF